MTVNDIKSTLHSLANAPSNWVKEHANFHRQIATQDIQSDYLSSDKSIVSKLMHAPLAGAVLGARAGSAYKSVAMYVFGRGAKDNEVQSGLTQLKQNGILGLMGNAIGALVGAVGGVAMGAAAGVRSGNLLEDISAGAAAGAKAGGSAAKKAGDVGRLFTMTFPQLEAMGFGVVLGAVIAGAGLFLGAKNKLGELIANISRRKLENASKQAADRSPEEIAQTIDHETGTSSFSADKLTQTLEKASKQQAADMSPEKIAPILDDELKNVNRDETKDFSSNDNIERLKENLIHTKNNEILEMMGGELKIDTAETPFGSYRAYEASSRGGRAKMEDTSVATWLEDAKVGMVAVFDGHGGAGVAKAAIQVVPEVLNKHLAQLSPEERKNQERVRAVIKNAFAAPDALRKDGSKKEDPTLPTIQDRLKEKNSGADGSGATAVVALFIEDQIYIANLGDSRAVLVNDKGEAQRLSVDQKPVDEKHKVLARKGATDASFMHNKVCAVKTHKSYSYVDGKRLERHEQKIALLSTARALGDDAFLVGRRPQVTSIPAKDAEHCALLLGCDGIFDKVHDKAYAGYIRKKLAAHQDPKEIAADLIKASFKRKSRDNMTAMLIPLISVNEAQ